MLSDLVSLQRDGGQALLHLSASYHVLGFQDADCQTSHSWSAGMLHATFSTPGIVDLGIETCVTWALLVDPPPLKPCVVHSGFICGEEGQQNPF